MHAQLHRLRYCGCPAVGGHLVPSLLQAVDPPTKGVPLRQLLRLQLDAAASGIAVHFCGNSQVRITAHGTLVTFPVLMRVRACLGSVMG